jgi:nucleoside-diphosphate-sugar epimerase
MKIAVTGVTGFTGRYFCEAAQARGHDILPLACDLRDAAGLAAALSATTPDALVHLAAISFVGHADNDAFYAVNVVGTANLLAAAAALPRPPRALVASSANVYGNNVHAPISEQEPPAPVNHYAASKLAMEFMAKTFADRLPLTIVRPFNYTGPGQGINFVIPKIIDHFRRKSPSIELGNVHVEREFNDVRTVCDAYLALLEEELNGEIFNICSSQTYTLQYVVSVLERLTGHHLEIHVNPAFVRANEVHRLCGSPDKLDKFLSLCGRSLFRPSLDETLSWMLRESAA